MHPTNLPDHEHIEEVHIESNYTKTPFENHLQSMVAGPSKDARGVFLWT